MPDTSAAPLAELNTSIAVDLEQLPEISHTLEDFWQLVDRTVSPIGPVCGARLRMEFDMAVWEVGTNIVRHGHPPRMGMSNLRMELRLRLHDDRVEAQFADRGVRWVEGPTDSERTLCTEDVLCLPESGLGLHIVRRVLDEFSYRRTSDGTNHWALTKLLRPASQ